MILTSIPIILYIFYVVINISNLQVHNETLTYLSGGIWSKLIFVIIQISYAYIAFAQYRAGCEHLLADCYKDSLIDSWLIIKDIVNLVTFMWLLLFIFRLLAVGYRRTVLR